MKYKLLKKIENCDWEVGELIETIKEGTWNGSFYYNGRYYSPIDIALLEHCGFIERVEEKKPWNPRELKLGDKYWFTSNERNKLFTYPSSWQNDEVDRWRLATNNVHETREAAEAYRDAILAGKQGEV